MRASLGQALEQYVIKSLDYLQENQVISLFNSLRMTFILEEPGDVYVVAANQETRCQCRHRSRDVAAVYESVNSSEIEHKNKQTKTPN